MLRRSRSILRISASIVRPMYSPMSAGRRMSTCDAGRNTGTPMSTSKPPLILRVTLPAHRIAFFLRFDDLVPAGDAVGLALGDHHHAGIGFDLFQENGDFIADFDIVGLVGVPLAGEREDAFGFQADLDDDVVAVDVDDFSLEDGAVGEGGAGGFEQGGDFVGVILVFVFCFNDPGGLFVGETQLAHEGKINHEEETFRSRDDLFRRPRNIRRRPIPPGSSQAGCRLAGTRRVSQ